MDILKRDGLSLDLLKDLSFQSDLGIRLKKNLHYFDKKALFSELLRVIRWYDSCECLNSISADYRVKSVQSSMLKYDRYYPNRQASRVFNDLLSFRTLCDSYTDVLELSEYNGIRVADLSAGKAKDDGYRGVHVYFQLSSYHYPIEMQYNTYYDRQFNDWLHKYIYKRGYTNKVGYTLRQSYENSEIRNESEFREVLGHVLSGSEKI